MFLDGLYSKACCASCEDGVEIHLGPDLGPVICVGSHMKYPKKF